MLLAAAAAAQELPAWFTPPRAYVAAVGDRIVAHRAPREHHQPASLAKLAGAMVVLEARRADPGLLQAPVTVSSRAARAGGTRLGLRSGERMLARDLLAATIVGSANDACLALAEHVAGTAQAFVKRMNGIAARLGMTDTHFMDPCGFDQPGQRTTALDMLKLANAALGQPEIVALAQEQSIRVETAGKSRAFTLVNTNMLLGRYSGAFGLKTGYTAQARQCLIAAARKGETVAVVVVLGGEDRWPVSAALLDYAFDRVSPMPRVQDPAAIGKAER
jgi:D-alanyl-D-alanine carboxypeptidase (penicillin-binding protein 5/6)